MAQETDYITPLVSLYAKLNQNKQLNNQYDQLQQQQQQQLNTLNSTFAPNNQYADVMRQQLERRDAARGARSQYGTREVELMAKLAGQQGQAQQAGLQALYSPQAMQFAQARAGANRGVSDPASMAMYAKMLGGLPSLFKAGQGLYRTYDAADKLNKFKDAISLGTAVDDTVDPGLWSNVVDYAPAISSGLDWMSGALNVGDIYNYADYANTAADFSDLYTAYDAASTAADTASAVSSYSDLANWWG